MEFQATEQFLNPMGAIQGGFLTAMLDETMGPAAISALPAGQGVPTLELKVSFIRPARPGPPRRRRPRRAHGPVGRLPRVVARHRRRHADRDRDRHGANRPDEQAGELIDGRARSRNGGAAVARAPGGSRRARLGRRDRDVPGDDQRRRPARVRGLPRDGGGADRCDRRRGGRTPRASRPLRPSIESEPSRAGCRA